MLKGAACNFKIKWPCLTLAMCSRRLHLCLVINTTRASLELTFRAFESFNNVRCAEHNPKHYCDFHLAHSYLCVSNRYQCMCNVDPVSILKPRCIGLLNQSTSWYKSKIDVSVRVYPRFLGHLRVSDSLAGPNAQIWRKCMHTQFFQTVTDINQ